MGELVLCPQVISRQAKEHGLTLDDELGYIMLHGVLHLLGFDHEKNKVEETKMMTLQDEVFENLRNPKAAKKSKVEEKDTSTPVLRVKARKPEQKKVIGKAKPSAKPAAKAMAKKTKKKR